MHNQSRSLTAKALLILVTLYVVWGSTYLAMRIAVREVPPLSLAGARFVTTGLILWILTAMQGRPRPNASHWKHNAVVGLLLLVGGNGFVVWALQYVHSGISALVVGVMPIVMVLVEWAWPGGVRPRALVSAGLALGFAGVAWLAAPWHDPAVDGIHYGALAALLAATVSWAIGSVYSRHIHDQASPLVSASIQQFCAGWVLLALAGLRGEWRTLDLASYGPQSWWAFAYLVVVGSLIGYSCFIWLMRYTAPAVAASYAFVNPVVAIVLGYLILDEPITPRITLAAPAIVIAVALITWQKNNPRHTS